MKIVEDYPPMFDEIDAAFKVRGKPVIFAWGDTIYNPKGVVVPRALVAHEQVHGERQRDYGIKFWWECYIADKIFRLREEVLAHRAEYLVMCGHGDRAARRRAMKIVSKKLAAPLYGRMINEREAKRAMGLAA